MCIRDSFRWVWFHIQISKVTGPNFTRLVSPNAGGIAVNGIKIRFWIYSSVSPPNFEVVRNRAKFCMFSPPKFFWGAPPKILDRHYKIRPSTDQRAKFQAGRPTHPGDLMLGKKTSCVKQKSFRKLSFSGGLINQTMCCSHTAASTTACASASVLISRQFCSVL